MSNRADRVSDREIGVALLGYGAIAEVHALGLRRLGARLVVVAGPDRDKAQAFATEYGFEHARTDAQDAITMRGVDAVVIASPTSEHARQARQCIEAGRHALVEIPLSRSWPEGRDLVELAASADRTLGVCHTLRFAESMRRALDHLEGLSGPPTNVLARSLLRRRGNVGWTGRQRSWTDDLLWHHGGHSIDASLQLLRAQSASVTSTFVLPDGHVQPLDYAISLQTDRGSIGSVVLSYNSFVAVQDFVVVCEDETLSLTASAMESSTGLSFAMDPKEAAADAIRRQDGEFLTSVDEGRPFSADARGILGTLAIQQAIQDQVDAARRSAGRTIRPGET